MNRIGLGTAQFGFDYGITNVAGRIPEYECSRIILKSSLSGIEVIDTAISYGESESCLGRIGVHGFKVISKLPPVPSGTMNIKEWIFSQVSESLSRLGLKSLYGLLLHDHRTLRGPFSNEIIKSLRCLIDENLIENAGISLYSATELEEIVDLFDWKIIQAPLNVFDRRIIESGWLDRLHRAGIQFHARSIFLQGLLLSQKENLPKVIYEKWSTQWDQWYEWLQENSISPLDASLGFVLSKKNVDQLIVGVRIESDLDEILKSSYSNSFLDVPYPKFHLEDERLINPFSWNAL